MKTQYKLGMLVSYIGFLVSTISGFVLPPIIISYLGKELNGLYNALTGFSVYFGMMDLGLGTAIIRYVAKYRNDGAKDKISKYLYVMRNVYFYICGITFIIGCAVTVFVPEIFKASIPIGYEGKAKLVFFFSLLSIVFTIFDNLYYSTIKAYEQFFVSRSTAILRTVLRVIIIIGLLNFGYSIVAVSLADCCVTLLILVSRMIYTKKKLRIYYLKPDKGDINIKEVFGFSLYVVVYSLTEKVFWQLDKVVLGIMSGGISVTIYTIGSQISSSISSVSSTVSSMYLPHAVKVSATRTEYTTVMAQMARYQLFVIIPVFMGVIFLGKEFLYVWVGNGYNESHLIAIVLIFALIPVLLQSYGEALLKAMNVQKMYAMAMAVSVVINILLTIVLVPGLGALGAAIASAIVNTMRCTFMAFFYQKKLGIGIGNFIKLALQGLSACICILGVAGFLLSNYLHIHGWIGLAVKIVIFAFVYLVSLYFIAFNEHESKLANSILSKLVRRKVEK